MTFIPSIIAPTLLFLLLSVSCATSIHGHSELSFDYEAIAKQQEPEVNIWNLETEESGAKIQSPSCWLKAANALNMDSSSNLQVCNRLSPDLLKILAVEISKCHVEEDLGRLVFDYDNDPACRFSYRANLANCLKHLTWSGEAAYTQFLTHIHQLCTRVQHDLILARNLQASTNIRTLALAVEEQMQSTLKQQMHMYERWAQREADSVRSYHDFTSQVSNDLFKYQQQNLHQHILLKQQHDEWLMEQEVWNQEREKETRQNHLHVMQHTEEIKQLYSLVNQVKTSFKPWAFNLETLASILTNTYHLAYCYVVAFCNLIVVWFATKPYCLSWLRPYLYGSIVMMGMVQTYLVLEQTYKCEPTNRTEDTSSLCHWAFFVLEFIFYTQGLLWSCCCCKRTNLADPGGMLEHEGNERTYIEKEASFSMKKSTGPVPFPAQNFPIFQGVQHSNCQWVQPRSMSEVGEDIVNIDLVNSPFPSAQQQGLHTARLPSVSVSRKDCHISDHTSNPRPDNLPLMLTIVPGTRKSGLEDRAMTRKRPREDHKEDLGTTDHCKRKCDETRCIGTTGDMEITENLAANSLKP